jgi:hypothetical protein
MKLGIPVPPAAPKDVIGINMVLTGEVALNAFTTGEVRLVLTYTLIGKA